jgi:hypothetical protein
MSRHTWASSCRIASLSFASSSVSSCAASTAFSAAFVSSSATYTGSEWPFQSALRRGLKREMHKSECCRGKRGASFRLKTDICGVIHELGYKKLRHSACTGPETLFLLQHYICRVLNKDKDTAQATSFMQIPQDSSSTLRHGHQQ